MYRHKFLFIMLLWAMTGCYYDKAELLYPGSANCSVPAAPSFNTDVMPILNSRCNNCHAGNSPSGGISLANYTDVKKSVTNGSLMGSINWTSGFSPMPQGNSKIPSCEIQKIQTWIDQGALNN